MLRIAMNDDLLSRIELKLRAAIQPSTHLGLGTILSIYDHSNEEEKRALIIALAARVVPAVLRRKSSACGARQSGEALRNA